MNQQQKDQWLEALKSGKFKKCTGILFNSTTNSYCCLGVACEIFKTGFSYGNLSLYLQFSTPLDVSSLITKNDDNYTWKEAIEYIEKMEVTC